MFSSNEQRHLEELIKKLDEKIKKIKNLPEEPLRKKIEKGYRATIKALDLLALEVLPLPKDNNSHPYSEQLWRHQERERITNISLKCLKKILLLNKLSDEQLLSEHQTMETLVQSVEASRKIVFLKQKIYDQTQIALVACHEFANFPTITYTACCNIINELDTHSLEKLNDNFSKLENLSESLVKFAKEQRIDIYSTLIKHCEELVQLFGQESSIIDAKKYCDLGTVYASRQTTLKTESLNIIYLSAFIQMNEELKKYAALLKELITSKKQFLPKDNTAPAGSCYLRIK